MKIKKYYGVLIFIVTAAMLIHLSCTTDPVSGGTETGDAVGILYNPNGSRAVNAKVYIVSVDHNPKPIKRIRAIDSTITDDTGAFVVDSVPEGHYNILGSGDSGISYADSIFIDNDTIPTEVTDTLREPGTLRGVVRLQGDDDSRTVFILVFGTQTWTAPADSIGNFTLASMAEGTYHVRILTTLDDYSPLDIDLTILSGVDSTLADTVYLPFTGIPIPTGLTLSYDTLKQIVTLSWDQADTTLVKGYNVYRKHSDSDFVKINTALINNNTYSDSTSIQDQTYEYKVTAVNKGDNEGEKSSGVGVVVVSAFEIIGSFGELGNGDGQFYNPSGLTLGTDSSVFVVDVLNHRIQKFDFNGNFILKFGVNGNDSAQFNVPIDIAIDDSDNIYVVDLENERIQKFDSSYNLIAIWDTIGQRVVSIDIDSKNRIYILDANSYKVKKYDSEGNFILEWGSNGTSVGQFASPLNLAIDNLNQVYVVEGGTTPNRISIFDSLGNFIKVIQYDLLNNAYFENAVDIFIDNSGIYVTDIGQKKILKFDIDSNIVSKWGNKEYYCTVVLPNGEVWGSVLSEQTIYRFKRK